MTSPCLWSDLAGHVGHALSFPASATRIIHLIYGRREEELPTSAPWQRQTKCRLTVLVGESRKHPSIPS